jgi:hypothetical protein
LIAATIITDRGAGGVGAVEEIIARLLRIVPTRVANAVVNGVVPVEIVIRIDPVPATVVGLQRVMRPANTRIGAGNDDRFSFEPKRPNIGSVRIGNSRLDRFRRTGRARLQRRLLDRPRLRKVIVNYRVACDVRHIRAGRQCLGELPVAFHQNSVHDIERLILNVAFAQPLQNWSLCTLRFFQKGLVNEPAFLGFCGQIASRAEIGLVSEHDKKFGLLPIGGVFNYPLRHLWVERVVPNALAGCSDFVA